MSTVNGLPAHILLVHAVVVLLPLAAFLLVLTAVWAPARRRLAAANAILSVLVVILVPITTDAGEWLERRVPQSALLHEHTELGDTAIFYAIPIAILALVVWWRQIEATAPTGGRLSALAHRHEWLKPRSSALTRLIAALAIVIAAAGVYGTYRIGDSGAKATWTGNFSPTPAARDPHERPR
ncbi:DUF2231 domain-containing protein [Krasilnikovia sp. MM14-A1004]|uniref:DUF2231 domain-containing protein n=1 Tax=Krasilnikovia sp. MM14-A1004 TaxID=3373541 RepID=UPI00399D0D41